MKKFIAAVLVAIAFTSPANASDPQKLVGEWTGEWRIPGGPSDRIYLTVKKIEGEQVLCSVFIQGRLRYHNRDLACSGTFANGKLSLTVPEGPATLELTLVGEGQLRGVGEGQNRAGIVLYK